MKYKSKLFMTMQADT